MNRILKAAAIAAAMAGITTPALAQSVTSTNGATTVYDGIESEVTGNMMGGLQITAQLSGGINASGTWQNLGSGVWGARLFSGQTEYARVTLGGGTNTYGNLWRADLYTNADLNYLIFQGGVGNGNVIFDRPTSSTFFGSGEVICPIFGGGYSAGCRGQTPGSSTGDDFNIVNTLGDGYESAYENAIATYSGLVQNGSNAIRYDAYTSVSVYFDNFSNGPDNNETPFRFYLDTDIGTMSTVPEPSTYALMAAGLAGIAAAARRRRRA